MNPNRFEFQFVTDKLNWVHAIRKAPGCVNILFGLRCPLIKTWRPRQISIKISPKFVPNGPINFITALV